MRNKYFKECLELLNSVASTISDLKNKANLIKKITSILEAKTRADQQNQGNL